MRTHQGFSLLVLLLGGLLCRGADVPARLDSYGDPLPEGASARLGTVRYRIGDKESRYRFPPRFPGRRVRDLLRVLESPAVPPELLRPLRAVEILERLSTPESRRLLRTLARGDPAARLTREARAALKRWREPEKPKPLPRVIGHRALIFDAPENTLAGMAAALELRIGFEFDIRRSKDGVLVCMHDATVNRTTNGQGKVGDLTLGELKKLDAGSWLNPAFSDQRVPTLEEVFVLLKQRGKPSAVAALDLKVNDEKLAGEVVKLAREHGAIGHLVCIGETIESAALRRALREADRTVGIAVLAQKAEDLDAALKDEHADWVYVRFVPDVEQVTRAHKAGKKVFLAGKTAAGREPGNWNRARDAGTDALLTDYPLECRQLWRK